MSRTKEQSSKALPSTGLSLDFRTSPAVYKFLSSNAFLLAYHLTLGLARLSINS